MKLSKPKPFEPRKPRSIYTGEQLKARARAENVQRLTREKIELRKYNPEVESQAAVVPHGFLLPHIVVADNHLWGRWDYWMEIVEHYGYKHYWSRLCEEKGWLYMAKILNDAGGFQPLAKPIPRMNFSRKNQMVEKMLIQCLDIISQGQEYNYSRSIEYLLDWLLWGFGHSSQPERPKQPFKGPDVHERIYQVLDANLLQIHPYDYWGDLMAEYQINKQNAFYPTPQDVAEVITQILDPYWEKPNEKPRNRKLDLVNEPCCGTGRMLMSASNYSLCLVGVDISLLAIKATLVNAYLYIPWLARPLRLPDFYSDLLVGDVLANRDYRSIHYDYDYPHRRSEREKPEPAPQQMTLL